MQFLSNLPMVAKVEDISNHYTFTSQAPLNNISNSISLLRLEDLKILKFFQNLIDINVGAFEVCHGGI